MRHGSQSITSLENKRKGVKASVTRFEIFLASINENITITQIQNRREKFIATYDEFDKLQSQIEELDEEEYDQ